MVRICPAAWLASVSIVPVLQYDLWFVPDNRLTLPTAMCPRALHALHNLLLRRCVINRGAAQFVTELGFSDLGFFSSVNLRP